MAITRRQFVSTLGALAAAMGVGQADLAKITEAFGHSADFNGGLPNSWINKPKVIWVHGAECTGCSTSLLSLFEDARGLAIEGTGYSTLAALDLAVGGSGLDTRVTKTDWDPTGHPFGHRTVVNSAADTGLDFDTKANSNDGAYIVNIADVLIDFIDLQYHETVMGMGGDLAYQWLKDNMGTGVPASGSATPFVLVVEGAVQDKQLTGAWNVSGTVPWCAIGKNDASTEEHSFDDVVAKLAQQTNCKAVIAYGACASYGGYPGCVSPAAEFNGMSQTGATGVKDFLAVSPRTGADKVINVPGCPSNPWWLVLTVVAWMVDFANTGEPLGVLTAAKAPNPAALDKGGRLKAVFPGFIHGPSCPRYQDFLNNNFATAPGQAGCLQLIGCKGPSAKGLCNIHGWNSQQPRNDSAWEGGLNTVSGNKGSACTMAGAPCMGCTEKGYPDAFVPFVAR